MKHWKIDIFSSLIVWLNQVEEYNWQHKLSDVMTYVVQHNWFQSRFLIHDTGSQIMMLDSSQGSGSSFPIQKLELQSWTQATRKHDLCCTPQLILIQVSDPGSWISVLDPKLSDDMTCVAQHNWFPPGSLTDNRMNHSFQSPLYLVLLPSKYLLICLPNGEVAENSCYNA